MRPGAGIRREMRQGKSNMNVKMIEEIQCFSHWLGFASPPSNSGIVSVVGKGEGFEATDLAKGVTVRLAPHLVQGLLDAVDAPPLRSIDPGQFQVSSDLVRREYGSVWTDDCPEVLVKIVLIGGGITTIRSKAAHAYMIPWTVTHVPNGNSYNTFNIHIGQTLAGLLPDGFLNRDRISGKTLELYAKAIRRESTPNGISTKSPQINHSENEKALLRAVKSQRNTLAQLKQLIDEGVNVNVVDSVGYTALMHAGSPPFQQDKFQLLVAAGADVNVRRLNDGLTGLHLASHDKERVVEAWLKAGADINAVDLKGATPLMHAACWSLQLTRKLLSAGADVNLADHDGSTALMCAIESCRSSSNETLDLLKALLGAGANPAIRNKAGLTALDLAMTKARQDRIESIVKQKLKAPTDATRLTVIGVEENKLVQLLRNAA